MTDWNIAGVGVPAWALKAAVFIVGVGFVAFVALKVVQVVAPEMFAALSSFEDSDTTEHTNANGGGLETGKKALENALQNLNRMEN